MEFVNISLLAGGALMALPIVLHLVMRQQPKHVEFPALRFLRERREANRRRLRLKHWLLLLLRCAAILLLAAALARPSVASALMGNWIILAVLTVLVLIVGTASAVALRTPATRALGIGTAVLGALLVVVLAVLLVRTLRRDAGVLVGDEQAPVAAAFVFDTSPRMEYRQGNQTRLDQAQGLADWLIRQLPADSEVAVFTSRARANVFAVDLGAAKAAVESLRTTSVPQALPEVVADAITLLGTSDKQRREVYVFTDLTAAAWDVTAAGRLRRQLENDAELLIYLIDVGVEQPRNFALGQLRLSSETLSANSELTLETELTNLGPGGQRSVELDVERRDDRRPMIVDGKVLLPDSERRSLQSVNVPADGTQLVRFTIQGLEPGTTHGRVQIVGQDNLPFDDVRYFTVSVNEAWPVLIVRGVQADSRWLVEALAPYEFRQSGRARFRPEVIAADELPEKELASYNAVCLLDPGPLPTAAAQNLEKYVREGGSAAMFLGRNARPASEESEADESLLPGQLGYTWPRRRNQGTAMYLAPRDYQHPILAPFRPIGSGVPWQTLPIYRFWHFTQLDTDANVVVAFDNGQPAIVEQTVGRGRVITMTTPISDPANVPDRPAWNRLPTGLNAWPFLLLTRGILFDLVRSGEERLNYLAGSQATLRRRSPTEPDTYLLFTPAGDRPQEISADEDTIAVKTTTSVGAYRLKAKGGGFPVRGFSVNLPPSASRLERASTEQLDRAIGAGRYREFRSREEIEPGIHEERRGREFYPSLMAAVALLLALELALANRFYPKKAEAARGAIESFRDNKTTQAA